jgi:hypothetical protein
MHAFVRHTVLKNDANNSSGDVWLAVLIERPPARIFHRSVAAVGASLKAGWRPPMPCVKTLRYSTSKQWAWMQPQELLSARRTVAAASIGSKGDAATHPLCRCLVAACSWTDACFCKTHCPQERCEQHLWGCMACGGERSPAGPYLPSQHRSGWCWVRSQLYFIWHTSRLCVTLQASSGLGYRRRSCYRLGELSQPHPSAARGTPHHTRCAAVL